MDDSRIVRRLNVIIVLLLGIVCLLSYEYVSAVPIVLTVPILVPAVLVLAAWTLAKLSLAVESS